MGKAATSEISGVIGSKGIQNGIGGLGTKGSGLGAITSSPRYDERTEIDFDAVEIYEEEESAQLQGMYAMDAGVGVMDSAIRAPSTTRSASLQE